MSTDPKALYNEILRAHEIAGPGLEGILSYTSSEQCADPDIILDATEGDLEAAARYGEFTVIAAQAREEAAADLLRIPGEFEGTFGDWYDSASEEDRAAVHASFAVLSEGGEVR